MPEVGIFNLDADLPDLGEDIIIVQHEEEILDIEVLKQTLNNQYAHQVDRINLSLEHKSPHKSSTFLFESENKRNDQILFHGNSKETLEDIVLSKIYKKLEEERQIRINQLKKQLLAKERRILNLWEGIQNLQHSVEREKLFLKQEERQERLWKKKVGIYKKPDFTNREEIKKHRKKLLLNLPIEVIYKKNILEFKKYLLSELANVSIANEQEYFELINITPKNLVLSMKNFIAAWKNASIKEKKANMMDFQLEFKKYLYKQFIVRKLRRDEEYPKSPEQSESNDLTQSELKDEFIEREIFIPDDKYSLTSGLAHANFQELPSRKEQQSFGWFTRLQNWLHGAYHWVKNTLLGYFSENDDEKKSYATASLVEEKSPKSDTSSFYYFRAISGDSPQPKQSLPCKKIWMDKTPSFKTLHTLFAEQDDKKSDGAVFKEQERKESRCRPRRGSILDESCL